MTFVSTFDRIFFIKLLSGQYEALRKEVLFMDFRSLVQNKRKLALLIGFTLLIILQAIALISDNCAGSCAKQKDSGGNASSYGGGAYLSDNVSGSDTQLETPPEEQKPVIIPMLINTQNIMDKDFKPTNLVEIGDEVKGTPTIQMNATAFAAYKLMYADMQKDGVTLPSIISAYRSYSKQKQLYDAKVAQYGEGQKVTAVPGTSEHQYSASVDISTDGTCQNNFGELDIGKWVAANSYKYGFVVRYPQSKKDITGINFEPWHLRYVGVEHATAMYERGMCLEEYVEYLRSTYPNAVQEQSPDDFPAPRFAGDTEGVVISPVTVSDSSAA